MADDTPEQIENTERLWELADRIMHVAKQETPVRTKGNTHHKSEHLRGAKDMRIRVQRLRNGATKVVIIEEAWLATTGGAE